MAALASCVAGSRTSISSFVGRAQELSALKRLVAEHRLVTVTGIGGVGKFERYGRLSGNKVEDLEAGGRQGVTAMERDGHSNYSSMAISMAT